MNKNSVLNIDETTVFCSLRREHMTFEQVYEEIINFIKADPNCSYRISVGTDSQVGKKTVFVSCIHVHRVGRGAIGFLHKTQIDRPVKNLREKIYLETLASMQLAYMFDKGKMDRIYKLVQSSGKSRGVFF